MDRRALEGVATNDSVFSGDNPFGNDSGPAGSDCAGDNLFDTSPGVVMAGKCGFLVDGNYGILAQPDSRLQWSGRCKCGLADGFTVLREAAGGGDRVMTGTAMRGVLVGKITDAQPNGQRTFTGTFTG